MPEERSIAFLSLGCRVNQAEDSSYRQHSLESGWQIVDFKSAADIYVINTCAVTLEAERQSRQMIRQAKHCNPEATMVVTGCAGRSLQRHKEISQIVDLFVPNLQKDTLVTELRRFLGELPHPQFTYHFPPVQQSKTTRLNLKITDGCFESCSFCIIPAMRGTVRSLDIDEVIKRMNEASHLGYQEVILTGVHLGAYGHEQGNHGLDTLLERLNQETRIPAIRLSSLDPHEITDTMIQALATSPRICPYLHIPIQSGSNPILQAMRRRDTREAILTTVEKLRQAIPDISLTTDMIVGFPGETEADFEQSYALMQTIDVNKIHVFPYSVRPGTRAAFMKEHVASAIKQERTQRLLELSRQQKEKWLQSWVGKTVPVLLETFTRQGIGKGYTPHYMRVHVPTCQPTERNTFQSVRITAYDRDEEIAFGEKV